MPIGLWALMFLFNSGSDRVPNFNIHFWIEAIAIAAIIGMIYYPSRWQKAGLKVSFAIYLYALVALFIRNPYGILGRYYETISSTGARSLSLDHSSIWIGLSIIAIGMAIELLVYYFQQYRVWAWWLAMGVSIFYVSTVMFFFPGALGIYALLDPDTKKMFRKYH
jgi:hypothetical protein